MIIKDILFLTDKLIAEITFDGVFQDFPEPSSASFAKLRQAFAAAFVSVLNLTHSHVNVSQFKVRRDDNQGRVTRFDGSVKPRNTGCQGTNKFYLLLADFHYCQNKKKEMT